jgi:hypothetical protein
MVVRLAAEGGRGAGEQLGLEVTWAWTSMPMTISQSPVSGNNTADKHDQCVVNIEIITRGAAFERAIKL